MAKQHINFNSRLIAGYVYFLPMILPMFFWNFILIVWFHNRRIPPGNKSACSLENDAAKCYCYTTADGISATAITDNEYQEKAAFILLSNIILDFRDFFSADPSVYEDAVTDLDGKIGYPNMDGFLKKW